jgi:hypothetical protein
MRIPCQFLRKSQISKTETQILFVESLSWIHYLVKSKLILDSQSVICIEGKRLEKEKSYLVRTADMKISLGGSPVFLARFCAKRGRSKNKLWR